MATVQSTFELKINSFDSCAHALTTIGSFPK